MLTATYSLVAIATEQKKTRSVLNALHQRIFQDIDLTSLDSTFRNLVQFDKNCRTRKVEIYVIPAVRRVSNEADSLLAEIESLSAKGIDFLETVRKQLGLAFDREIDKINEVCRLMDLYCHHLLKRLEKEEDELFPLMGRLFSIEEWFCMAEKFLSDEAEHHEHKRAALVASHLMTKHKFVIPLMAGGSA